MSYDRLTVRFNQIIEMKKCDRWNNCSNCSDFEGCPKIYDAITRLAKLEDKIENGLLVERYFIKDDITPYGKVFHNVCEYDPSTYIIIQQCDTISEAEEKLRELRGEK